MRGDRGAFGTSGLCQAIRKEACEESESITTSFPFKAIKPIDFDLFFPSLYSTVGVFITLLLFGFS